MYKFENFAKAVVLLALATLTLAACDGKLFIDRVITATPNPNVIEITVTPSSANKPTQVAVVPTQGAVTNASTPVTPPPVSSLSPTLTSVSTTAATAAAPQAQSTATLIPSPTLSAFPTNTRAELYIAQQDFEHGYMFWISTQKVIWVLITDTSNPNSGTWTSYPDTWDEKTDPEIDVNLNPTGPNLYQPRRGFGKLWRNTKGLKEALGWGKTPEFGLNTTYVYQPSGTLDTSNKFIPGPGTHFLTTLDRRVFALTEPLPGAMGTWKIVG